MRHGNAALRGEECRELVGAVAENRDALCLQHLERFGEVEDGFGASADHGDVVPREFIEVRADVPRVCHAAVHPADASRHEHPNARQSRTDERAADGGRTEVALGQHDRHVAP